MRPLIEGEWLRQGGDFDAPVLRAVSDRCQGLMTRISTGSSGSHLGALKARLNEFERELSSDQVNARNIETRRALYLDGRRLARDLAFANPRLREITNLLFITRHDSGGVFHMVDQFYGFNAKPGGALLVLVDPFGGEPRLLDLLKSSVVQNGRLKGRRLEGGSFLSPEVSFDGQTILFAWTECQGKDLEWSLTASHHIFKVNADGSDLTQLTDGPWNDFDPCFLPNGRIAFVSERRGGFLRCGRHCPTYTMFDMAADGSGIACLSFHETHEWQPSVAHDGRIVYTRWDYVDRDTNIGHHPWSCRPDGSDPRALHGNYPTRRENRPWMEMDIRAIPGSRKFVATAAAHHGQAFGSLVLIDPEIEDDGALSQVTRLTPETPFPEAEKHLRPIEQCMVYGTAWPLSETDFLCAYDPTTKNRGIYWIDRFGNKELIYRDPAISALSPMPVQGRPTPPVLPDVVSSRIQARELQLAQPAEISVMNVYDSDFEWPAGTKIAALRVIQLLPKTTPAPNDPRIGIAEQTNARAVLGTVPVELDGSAYFEAPSGKALYFQALDDQGLAVQSMRSVTYLHPGEHLSCQGCHERKHNAPRPRDQLPLALRRPASRIERDVDGSNPFNFVRLVQPALDRNCVSCHREKRALDLSGVVGGKHLFSRSYENLAGTYGFYFDVFNGAINNGVHGGSRTVAGQFGAKASRLLPFLEQRHYGAELSREDFHRVTLWLDCNSEFFGSYENIKAQARGEIVWPTLD